MLQARAHQRWVSSYTSFPNKNCNFTAVLQLADTLLYDVKALGTSLGSGQQRAGAQGCVHRPINCMQIFITR